MFNQKDGVDLGKKIDNELSSIEKLIDESLLDIEQRKINENESKKEELELQKIEFENLEQFPLEIDFKFYLDEFFNSEILKPIETRSLNDNFTKYFNNKYILKLTRMLFWVIFLLKFSEENEKNKSILMSLRKKISMTYVKLFTRLPKPKDDLINLLIFSIGYVLHSIYFSIFVKDRNKFKLRFILDCYHIAIFELNGIYVSDYYLQNSFERLFTGRFLEYERIAKNEGKQFNKNKKKERSFLGQVFNYSPKNLSRIEGGIEFAEELSMKFKKKKRSPKKLGQTNPNTISSFDDKFATQQEEAKKKLEDPSTESKRNLDRTSLQQKVESIPGRVKFNCIQISPTVSNFLENDSMVIPSKKNKVIKHSLEKMELNKDYREIFNEIKNETLNKRESTKKYISKAKSMKSIKDSYGVKFDYDEKARKYPEFFKDMEDLYFVMKKYQENTQNWPSSKKMYERQRNAAAAKFGGEEEKKYELDSKERTKYVSPFSFPNIAKKNVTQNFEPEILTILPSLIIQKENEVKSALRENDRKEKDHKDNDKNVVFEDDQKPKPTWLHVSLNLKDKKKEEVVKKPPVEKQQKNNLSFIVEEKGGRKQFGGSYDVKNDEEESKKNKNFQIYSDKRKDYNVKYSNLVHGNPDKQINDLIHTIMIKQNQFIKNMGKVLKKK